MLPATACAAYRQGDVLMKTISQVLASLGIALWMLNAGGAPIVFSAAGNSPADIQATVDAFRAALGTLNPNVSGSFGTGRREINWDGVPNSFAAPNNLPANFFNVNSPRGVVFATPGTGFQVSANAGVAPVEFGNINPNYPNLFEPFSAQRLFTALDSTVTDVSFFIPGSTTPAFTTGFGAVFTDVDLANTSSLQFFGPGGSALADPFPVPNASGDETLSFLGVLFNAGELVSKVRVTSGNQALSAANTANDVTVLDDFIYGEPRLAVAQVPEPGALVLFAIALTAFGFSRRKLVILRTKFI
jgi:PEP-CTERM motif